MNKHLDNVLPIGTILKGKSYHYEIVKVLGQGSFGITYLAARCYAATATASKVRNRIGDYS